jgi:hypothetical protein
MEIFALFATATENSTYNASDGPFQHFKPDTFNKTYSPSTRSGQPVALREVIHALKKPRMMFLTA